MPACKGIRPKQDVLCVRALAKEFGSVLEAVIHQEVTIVEVFVVAENQALVERSSFFISKVFVNPPHLV